MSENDESIRVYLRIRPYNNYTDDIEAETINLIQKQQKNN